MGTPQGWVVRIMFPDVRVQLLYGTEMFVGHQTQFSRDTTKAAFNLRVDSGSQFWELHGCVQPTPVLVQREMQTLTFVLWRAAETWPPYSRGRAVQRIPSEAAPTAVAVAMFAVSVQNF